MRAQSTRNTVHYSKQKSIQRPASKYPLVPSSWKVGKYWDNSGTQNPTLHKNYSEAKIFRNRSPEIDKNPLAWPQKSLDSNPNSQAKKNFTSNSESRQAWDPKFSKYSMINYQNRDYNLITHTVSNRPETTTTSRQKGFGEFIDSARPNKKEYNSAYQEVLQKNPKTFHRQSGQFTLHQDNCVKLSGFGPFHRALS